MDGGHLVVQYVVCYNFIGGLLKNWDSNQEREITTSKTSWTDTSWPRMGFGGTKYFPPCPRLFSLEDNGEPSTFVVPWEPTGWLLVPWGPAPRPSVKLKNSLNSPYH